MLLVKVAILTLFHPQQVTVNGVEITRKALQNEESRTIPGPVTVTLNPSFTRTYRGALQISAANNELQLILHAELEDLVAATVSAESPPSAPPEALKAQAILARSWIVASRKRHGAYDLCDTTHCQHFKEPTPRGIQAARATRGLVLAWQGKPFAPAYSASCGGRTRTAADVGWPDTQGYPYFAVDCAVCQKNEQTWTRQLDPADVKTLRQNPHKESVRLAINRRLGWSGIPSNSYQIEGETLKGRGQGHGLGYCQRGAAAMAATLSAAEILRHYFPGTVIIANR